MGGKGEIIILLFYANVNEFSKYLLLIIPSNINTKENLISPDRRYIDFEKLK